jgi:hypothetical protein
LPKQALKIAACNGIKPDLLDSVMQALKRFGRILFNWIGMLAFPIWATPVIWYAWMTGPEFKSARDGETSIF